MFDVITIGGATRDVFFTTDEGKIIKDKESLSGKMLAFEYGAKIVPKGSYFSYGGGAANTSSCFAKMGLKVGVKINIGKEGTGSLINKTLRDNGVNTLLVERDDVLHTALSLIISNNGDHTMFLYRGANDNLQIKKWGKIKKTKWLYVSSLTGNSSKNLERIGKIAGRGKVKLAWNPGSQQLDKGYRGLKDILKVTNILILNKAEAKDLASFKGKESTKNDEALLKKLRNYGPEIVVVTDGLKGSLAYDGQYVYKVKAERVKTVETTGAGDAYGSTFVAGIIKGHNIKESMKLASKNAASVVSKIGAQEGQKDYKTLARALKSKVKS